VLFAILVTTIGLLGALALLPVASSQAKKGRQNDANAVAASTCVHEFDARGMRRGASVWIAWDPGGTPGYRLVTNQTTALPNGTSFCIDPRMIAASDATVARRNGARQFPYSPTAGQPVMLRCTLGNNAPTVQPMGKLLADSIFTIDDDLTYDRADDNTIAPTQQFEFMPSAATVRSRRQNDGHMSWMATVVPKVDRYTVTATEQFVLSIVVFYDRPTSFGWDEGASTFSLPDERTVNVAFPGGGITGGEVLLAATTEAELKLRPHDWIMLSGLMTHAISTPIPVFKWYRVSDLEAEVTFNGTNYERYVTLTGPDWDTLNIANPRAVIVEGVVGVYEKTIRLE
jgi:hypothetical protein